MAKVKIALGDILMCTDCYGAGWQFWANGVNLFDSEACECNPHGITPDEINDWKN